MVDGGKAVGSKGLLGDEKEGAEAEVKITAADPVAAAANKGNSMRLMPIRMMTLVRGLTYMAVLTVPLRAGAFEQPKDPCSVLTLQEVSAALGAKSMEPKHVVATLCEWDVSGPPSDTSSKKLTLGFLSASAWEQTRSLREGMKSFTRTSVEGLGEEAVFSTNGRISTLQVKKGSAVLDMHLYGFPPDQAKGMEITLARAALGRF